MKTSMFLNVVYDGDKCILHNAMYPNLVKINDPSLFPVVEAITGREDRYDLKFDDEDCQQFYEDLIKAKIIIPDATEELNLINFYYRMHLSQQPLWVFMFPTRNCNFRCPYCYEEHEEKIMSDEIYEKTLEYIAKSVEKYGYKSVIMSWFGGEPLLKYENVISFMKKLREILPYDINVHGQITTNGYLLTPEHFDNLVDVGVVNYQITIDGLAETHNKSRILANGGQTWSTIINNLQYAKQTDKKFIIVIRTNITNEIMQNLEEWIIYLKENFGNDKRFAYHFEMVKDLGGEDRSLKFKGQEADSMETVHEILRRYNLGISASQNYLKPFNFMCYAANPHSIGVDWDGSLRKCTVSIDEDYNKVGNIDGTINPEIFAWWTDYELRPECKSCSVLPLCYGRKCPQSYGNFATCKTLKANYMEALKSMLQ